VTLDPGGREAPRLGMWPGLLAYLILLALTGWGVRCAFWP
jgi:hypothetical protein